MKRLLFFTVSLISIFSSIRAFAESDDITPDITGNRVVGVEEIVVTSISILTKSFRYSRHARLTNISVSLVAMRILSLSKLPTL